MRLARRAWCRAYQTAFRIALPVLPYFEPQVADTVEKVPELLAKHGVTTALLVTDPGVARLGLTHGLEDALAAAGIACEVYDGTVANPTIANVEQAAAIYRERDCGAIIGFGGGSAMDCAKGVGARIAQPAKPIQKMRGLLRVHRALPPLVAVPTTAGTGSEVTLAAVITDEKSHYKYPINDFALIPRYAVHDWRLTRGLPPAITGQTGMDALTHAVEAYIGRSTTRHTRRMATEAVRLVHDNLLDAYRNGGDERARTAMMEAAYKAGVAFTQSYVGYVHAIAHSLGGQYGTPHGLANAVILPHVLRAYGDAAAPRLAELARAAGVCAQTEPDALAAEAFIAWVECMNEALGIPCHLRCIREEDIPLMAAHADAEANPLYPVPALWDKDQLERMYHVVAGPVSEPQPARSA